MIEALKANVLPAWRLPKVVEAWEEPKHEEFSPRTAWSLFNAFTEVERGAGPRQQMEGTLRLSALFRRELQLQWLVHEATQRWMASFPLHAHPEPTATPDFASRNFPCSQGALTRP
jgi:hypothetical protein